MGPQRVFPFGQRRQLPPWTQHQLRVLVPLRNRSVDLLLLIRALFTDDLFKPWQITVVMQIMVSVDLQPLLLSHLFILRRSSCAKEQESKQLNRLVRPLQSTQKLNNLDLEMGNAKSLGISRCERSNCDWLRRGFYGPGPTASPRHPHTLAGVAVDTVVSCGTHHRGLD